MVALEDKRLEADRTLKLVRTSTNKKSVLESGKSEDARRREERE